MAGVRVGAISARRLGVLWLVEVECYALHRHSRVYGNPGDLACCRFWTPAFAGVTIGLEKRGNMIPSPLAGEG